MSAKLQGPFLLGSWYVDPELDTIARGNQTLKLEPRMMRLLLCLVEASGTVVRQERLLAEVWAGVVVGQASVYQAVSQLRRLLGDVDPPSYIATVPRKGYRLVATVRAVESRPVPGELSSPLARPQTLSRSRLPRFWLAAVATLAAAAGVSIWRGWLMPGRWLAAVQEGNSIVVLPLNSDDPADQPFCDGLTEELSNWLAQLPNLRVVAQTSAFSFRGRNEDVRSIGRILGANHVLEGSVHRSGNRMRVIVQLIDAKTGYQAWSSEYDQPMEDAIRIQTDIARSVADSMEIRLTADTNQRLAERRSDNPQAYTQYLRARAAQQSRTPEANQQAIDLYRSSVAADPQFALAYVGLAYAIINQRHLNGRSVDEVTAGAEPLLAKAAELDPDLSELYAVRAALRDEQGRTPEALTDLKHAVTLNPNDSWAFAELARLHSAEGEPHTALHDLQQALVLNPLDFVVHARHCLVLQDLGRFAQATAACERARSLEGSGGNWATVVSEWLAWSQGNLKQAMIWSGQALKFDPQSIGAYERRAEIMLTLGMAAAARDLYRQAEVATHDEEAIQIGLGKVAYCQNGADGLRQYLATTDLDHSPHARTLIDTAYLQLLLGEPGRAVDLVQRATKAADFDPVRFNAAWFARWGWSDQLIRAAAEVGTGDSPGAAKDLQQVSALVDRLEAEGEQRGSLYALKAEVLALSGSNDGAMRELSQAVGLGWRESWWAEREPYLASLRSRPDFRTLMARVDEMNRRTRAELAPDQ
jgi:TolB-like protein/DNA-binding winged helix-turn-helix (wHTH) protein/Tfp pilus assembly protein PilF